MIKEVVYAVDNEFSEVESFAVVDGKIIAVGTSENMLANYASETIVGANGNWIYPGLNDAHCHFTGYGIKILKYADLRGTQSTKEIYDILKRHHAKFGGEWILGRSRNQNDWDEKVFPDKSKLMNFSQTILFT